MIITDTGVRKISNTGVRNIIANTGVSKIGNTDPRKMKRSGVRIIAHICVEII